MIDALGLGGPGGDRADSRSARLAERRRPPRPSPRRPRGSARWASSPRPGAKEEAARAYEALLLDAPGDIQEVAGRTLGRLDAAKAAELISARLERKGEAGLDVAPEITLLGELPRRSPPRHS